MVTVKYKLSDAQGNVIEEGAEPMEYLHGGYENILPKIEAVLDGKQPNYKVDIQLEPEDAFGEYDVNLLKVEARSLFPEALEVGMQFEGIPEKKHTFEEELIFTVTDIADDKVVLDANHPLAGIAVRFSLQVTGVRAATQDEIKHQHVHGSYGFHDDDEEGAVDEYRSYSIH